ncbi:hypothetical protein JTE90_003875 [Oedothorax gibbosus]|uniref:ubiquitinyl hydrolase 1 n=1 Tax=Oedothorax gibbosus TaxID=931172 RepID=A0AAV6UHG1_9ARAC|nr:hypothetical protein JTE90_003875 [Oedothorax gibbosus]
MTVEQSPLEHFPNQKPPQPPLLNVDKEGALSPTTGVIDLTNDGSDKDDDLKKAIALSLKEHEKVLGGQVSMEDQDISRVIEASMAETKAGTKRKREEIWVDPLNPHDRTRNRDWPVGLKNVGNTCWFSAVIQSLFHLPVFRKLVLSYVPKDWNVVSPNSKYRRNLIFMQELRKLFALMLCSKRKYVNPSLALEEFKEAFPDSSGTDSQQDVSEFTHKLLEWLEDAFKITLYDQNGETLMEGSDTNPMLNLFYGSYLSEGQNEGRMFSNEETFGQYPLQVNGFSNIHESLEAAMSQEIESYDVMTKSGQESWFTQIPPVLLFELSRFQFNQQMGRPEKIHNKLEFPEIMYMDRYMEPNKAITRLLREQVHKLKDKRAKLLAKLEKFMNFGSGQRKLPINDILQYTLEFAESQSVCNENSSEDIEMASPASVASAGAESPSSNATNKSKPMEIGSTSRPTVPNMTTTPEKFNHVGEDTVPSPHHISGMELRVLQSCLKRWRNETEYSVKELQEKISNIENTIKDIYNDPNLQQNPYRLHAVLVHEGQAASGHYWAYIYCPTRRLWLKFNDVSVTDTTWSDVQRDSMGGHHCASAYCLLYVDESRPDLFDDSSEVEIGPDFLYTLPEDLLQYVEEDNENFRIETENWDLEQSRKKDSSTMTVGDGDCTIIGERRLVLHNLKSVDYNQLPRTSFGRNDMSSSSQFAAPHDENKAPFFNALSMEHAALLKNQTLLQVKQIKVTPGQTAMDAIAELLMRETNALKRLARVNGADDRLHHIGVYIIMNSSGADMYLNWSILEQYFIPELDEFPNGVRIKEAAMQKLETFRRSLNDVHFATYKKWHKEYHQFRKMVQYFVIGVEKYHNKCYDGALQMFNNCSLLNDELWNLEGREGKRRGLDCKLVEHYRKYAALHLNDTIAEHFEKYDVKDALEALTTAYEYILPSMEFLISLEPEMPKKGHQAVVDKIRDRWCSMVESEVPIVGPKQQPLEDFLNKLMNPSDFPKKRPTPAIQVRIPNLEERYRAAMVLATQLKGKAENEG